MDHLVYPRERTLGTITLVLGLLAWLVLIAGTFGGALIGLGAGFILYLFAQSSLIAYIKGNGVELSATQFPDLHAQFSACCERLQIGKHPQVYILNGSGHLNAFATKFLGTQFVVLLSDVVDAMDQHPDGVRFYMGHELGHLRMKHLSGHLLRWPVLWLPLLGAAYSRARESTCDRHGLACCASPEGAGRALAALSTGTERWKQLDIPAYLKQTRHASGFWMSFHELIAGYPWLTKRVARVMGEQAMLDKQGRNGLAYFLALFVPYAGRLGAGFGMLVVVYIIGVLAAIAIPQFHEYQTKAKVMSAVTATQPARDALSRHWIEKHRVPETLESIGVATQLPNGVTLSLDTDDMVLTAKLNEGEIIFYPSSSELSGNGQGHVEWGCRNGKGLTLNQLPLSCRER